MKVRWLIACLAVTSACGGCDSVEPDPEPAVVVTDTGRDATTAEAGSDVAASDAGRDMLRLDLGPTDVGDDMGMTDMTVSPDMPAEPMRVCEPDGLPPGTYDPDCIYLLGTLLPGSAGTDVFTYPGSGEVHYGFGNYANKPVIRPTDGKLLFGEFSEWYVFEPDAVRMAGDPAPPYPDAPLDNDTLLVGLQCDIVGAGMYRVWTFPDDGELAYQCYNDNGNVYLGGTTDDLNVAGDELIALAPQRRILSHSDTNELAVVQNGVATTVTGIRDFERAIAGKWINGRFVVALFHVYAPADIEMWSVETDGTATSLGVVDLGTDYESYFQECVMDPQSRFYCFATPTGTLTDLIVAYSADAAPEMIWTEVGSNVAAHISYLATGP